MGAGLLLCGLLGPRAAGGQSASEGPLEEVSFEYHPAPCGEQKTFVERVRKRTTKFKSSEPKSDLRHFEITIRSLDGEHSAELRITSIEGETTTRTVTGETCEELFDAVALMTALAIDPSAPIVAGDSEHSNSSARDTTDTADAESASRPGDDASSSPLAPDVATTAPRDDERPPPPTTAPKRSRRVFRLGSAGDFVVTGGVVERALLGGEFHIVSEWTLGEYLAPTLRIFGSYQGATEVDAPVGSVAFKMYGGGAELCPVRVSFGGPILRPCVSGSVAGLSAKAIDVPDGRSEVQDYTTIGMTGRLELPLHRLISLEAGFGAHLPLRRDRFIVDSEVISRAQVVTAKGNLGVLIWFL